MVKGESGSTAPFVSCFLCCQRLMLALVHWENQQNSIGWALGLSKLGETQGSRWWWVLVDRWVVRGVVLRVG